MSTHTKYDAINLCVYLRLSSFSHCLTSIVLCVRYWTWRMTFVDFCKHFGSLSICHRVNTSVFSFQKRWHDTMFHGEWMKPFRAGGCSNHLATFFNNPQVWCWYDATDWFIYWICWFIHSLIGLFVSCWFICCFIHFLVNLLLDLSI